MHSLVLSIHLFPPLMDNVIRAYFDGGESRKTLAVFAVGAGKTENRAGVIHTSVQLIPLVCE